MFKVTTIAATGTKTKMNKERRKERKKQRRTTTNSYLSSSIFKKL